ncbi:zinc finger domain-like protein [Trypanosoma grayi]|uniref:zinc finger domain-like protein n=1 Tax=Trypanosoma grayi TaxID=71804 RepID=UPI0004F4B5A8|nr:zinc finger domain-like protein [Trypanosoma grayi]KEG13221.1 zinc finger domain-like protein [Trypanosoma grayi]
MEGLPTLVVAFLERCSSCVYTLVQLGGIVVFAFGLSLIVFCTLTFVRIALPLMATPGSLYFLIFWAASSALSFCILFNYVAAALFRSPAVSAAETRRLALEGEALPLRQQRRLLEAPSRFCVLCDRYKAPREHHCRVCKRCVTKMDHHCPWINNCVDAENHRFFFLFLVYLLLGAGLATVCLGVSNVCSLWSEAGVLDSYDLYRNRFTSFPVIFTLFLCSAISVCMIFFVGWTGLHILRNETQIERFIVQQKEHLTRNSMAPFRNPYDLGRWRNILEVFATKGDPLIHRVDRGGLVSNAVLALWLLLPTLRPAKCDGLHYQTFDDEVMQLV